MQVLNNTLYALQTKVKQLCFLDLLLKNYKL